jgi:uncharacterized SAM-binding protein YcdF (DUF218 family)
LLVVVLITAGILVLIYGPLQEVPARFLIVEDPLEEADAIAVLSGGRGDERVRQAAELYRAGYAPLVILSAPSTEDIVDLPYTEVLRRQALGHRIPESALLFETKSTSTAEEARNLRPILEGRRARRAIIVTSSYHSRRSRYLFQKLFAGSPVEVRIYPVQQDVFDPAEWWTRERDTEWVVLEYIKLGLAVARYR